MDARNHGDSPHTPGMSYELMSEDLVHFMKTQNIRKSFIIGKFCLAIILYVELSRIFSPNCSCEILTLCA